MILLFKDYEGFDIANEDDDLEEFLGIPRKNPKVKSELFLGLKKIPIYVRLNLLKLELLLLMLES